MSFPDLAIPWVAGGTNYCVFRFNRIFDGTFQGHDPAATYACDGTNTLRFASDVTFKITAAPGCDESTTLLPSGGLLTGRGTTFLRKDSFAHYLGRFTIVRKEFNVPDVTLFRGSMELIGRIGSHQGMGESCSAENHVEGWMVGRGEGPAALYTLRALIVGDSVLEPGVHGFLNAAVNRITGTLLRSP